MSERQSNFAFSLSAPLPRLPCSVWPASQTSKNSRRGLARATAETIKSECFRFAARAGPYAGDNAKNAFIERRDELAGEAVQKGLSQKADPVAGKVG
jgi:hypothetical protein